MIRGSPSYFAAIVLASALTAAIAGGSLALAGLHLPARHAAVLLAVLLAIGLVRGISKQKAG
jgi:hypothetical protein